MMMLFRPVLPVFALAALAGCANLPESSDTESAAAVAAAAATNAMAPKASAPGERSQGTPVAAAAAAAAAAVAAQGPQHRVFADIPGANGMLERAYRQSYMFDPRNSSISKVRATPELVAINVNAHYSLQRVAPPPSATSSMPHTPPPATVPDIRSLFLGFYYN